MQPQQAPQMPPKSEILPPVVNPTLLGLHRDAAESPKVTQPQLPPTQSQQPRQTSPRAALGRKVLLAAALLVTIAIALAVVGGLAVAANSKYDPVYQDITCGKVTVALGRVSTTFISTRVGMLVSVECNNPNPYTVKVTNPRQGKMYFQDTMDEIGVIKAREGTLPPNGGTVKLDATINLSGFGVISLVTKLLAGKVHVVMEVEFTAKVEEGFLFASIEVSPEFNRKCGYTLDLMANQNGDVVCGKTFNDLTITDVGVSAAPGNTGMMVDQKVIDDAEKKKAPLKVVMGVAFGLSAFFLICMMALVCRYLRKSRADTQSGDGSLHV